MFFAEYVVSFFVFVVRWNLILRTRVPVVLLSPVSCSRMELIWITWITKGKVR